MAEKKNRVKLIGNWSDFSVSESGGGMSSRFSSSAVLSEEDGDVAKEPSLPLSRGRTGISETDMMRERFSRLLLGEDMSGSGKGVSTALAISNAITNLFASIFGNRWRLEPLPVEKKEMWRRETEWFISVSDHIVEMVPSYKTFPDGTKLETMTCRPRSDLSINLPALRKLDNMLIEILDTFRDTQFWYADQGKRDKDTAGSIESQKEKWWLPVPRIPKDGLSTDSRRQFHCKLERANQILKLAMTINTDTISDMEVPDSYVESLPKTGRACLGDSLYRFIASDHFSLSRSFDCLDISAENVVSELVNRLEAAIIVWRKSSQSRLVLASKRFTPKSPSFEAERMKLLAGRAEDLLRTLRQKFPNLSQSTLEATKIQCNKDVGKSILESYSRVLETLAYNITTRINDLLSIDQLTNHSSSSAPSRVTSPTPCLSPTLLPNPSKSDIVPFLNKLHRRGSIQAKRVLPSYLWSGNQ
ncbi:hypothetical protein QQ045_016642 [Rhodiola kirilowii]